MVQIQVLTLGIKAQIGEGAAPQLVAPPNLPRVAMNSAPRRLLSLSRQLACPAVGTATPPLHVVRMAAAAAAPARALASACAPTPAAALSAAAAAGTTAGPSRAPPALRAKTPARGCGTSGVRRC